MSYLKLPKFDQIGILVKDIEKPAELCNGLLDFNGKINIVEQTTIANYKRKELT